MTFLCQKDMQLQAANHLGKYPHHFSFKRPRDCLPLIWQGQENWLSFRWPKLWNMEKSLANEIGFGSVRLSNSATRLKKYLVINLCSLSSHKSATWPKGHWQNFCVYDVPQSLQHAATVTTPTKMCSPAFSKHNAKVHFNRIISDAYKGACRFLLIFKYMPPIHPCAQSIHPTWSFEGIKPHACFLTLRGRLI